MKKEYYLYVNGKKVKVSEQIYKVYWREKEHEKYLEQVDRKNHLLLFSSLNHDEPVRSVAKLKSITHLALIKKRNKILEKLKKFIEEI